MMDDDLTSLGLGDMIGGMLKGSASAAAREMVADLQKFLPEAVRQLPERSEKADVGDRFGLKETLVTDDLVAIVNRACEDLGWSDVAKFDERINLVVQDALWMADGRLSRVLAAKRRKVRSTEAKAIDCKYTCRHADTSLSLVLADLEEAAATLQLSDNRLKAAMQQIENMQASRARMGKQTNILVDKTSDEVLAVETYVAIEEDRATAIWNELVAAAEENANLLADLQKRLQSQQSRHFSELNRTKVESTSRTQNVRTRLAEELLVTRLTSEQKIRDALVHANARVSAARDRVALTTEATELTAMERSLDDEEAALVAEEIASRDGQMAELKGNSRAELEAMKGSLAQIQTSLKEEAATLNAIADANGQLEENVVKLQSSMREQEKILNEKKKILHERTQFLLHQDRSVIDSNTRDLQTQLDDQRTKLKDAQEDIRVREMQMESFSRQNIGWKKLVLSRLSDITALSMKVEKLDAALSNKSQELERVRLEGMGPFVGKPSVDQRLVALTAQTSALQDTAQRGWEETRGLAGAVRDQETDFLRVLADCVALLEQTRGSTGDIETLIREHRANVLRISSIAGDSKAKERQRQGLTDDQEVDSKSVASLESSIPSLMDDKRRVDDRITGVHFDDEKKRLVGVLSQMEVAAEVSLEKLREKDIAIKKFLVVENKRASEISIASNKLTLADRGCATAYTKAIDTRSKVVSMLGKLKRLDSQLASTGFQADDLESDREKATDKLGQLKLVTKKLEEKEETERRWVELAEKELKEWQEDLNMEKDSFSTWKLRFEEVQAGLAETGLDLSAEFSKKTKVLEEIADAERKLLETSNAISGNKISLANLQSHAEELRERLGVSNESS